MHGDNINLREQVKLFVGDCEVTGTTAGEMLIDVVWCGCSDALSDLAYFADVSAGSFTGSGFSTP